MSFTFRKAVREQTSVLIALAGASGSGKTFSALRLARGLVGPAGKIAFLDTEAGRAKHYADRFDFDHGDMTPPFRPDRFEAAVAAAEKAGYGAIVIDSFSHEYEGVGGLQEWADELEAGGTKSPGNWKVPKLAHRKMVNRLLQCRAHLIFCLRADEKIKIERVNGKTAVIPLGWVPITEKRFMYELTVSFTMRPDAPGVGVPIKLQDQHRPFFPDGEPITERSGEMLGAWARGGAAPKVEGTGTPPLGDGAGTATGKPAAPSTDRAAIEAIGKRIAADIRAAATPEAVAAIWSATAEERAGLPDAWDDRLDKLAKGRADELRAATSDRPADARTEGAPA